MYWKIYATEIDGVIKTEGGTELRILENLPRRKVNGLLEVIVKGSEKTRAYWRGGRMLQQREMPRNETKMKMKSLKYIY